MIRKLGTLTIDYSDNAIPKMPYYQNKTSFKRQVHDK